MALQSSATAKTASDTAAVQARDILDSLIMTVINSAITVESEKTTNDFRSYKITISMNADVNGRTKPAEIIQSDDSKVLLSDIIGALKDKGYRTSFQAIKTRDGKDDVVKLQIAWD